jgi:hypothetical protein
MDLQTQLIDNAKVCDALFAERRDIEKKIGNLASTFYLESLPRDLRAIAPQDSECLRGRIRQIDAELKTGQAATRALNLQHLAASRTKAALPESEDVKRAARLIGTLETKREVLQETIARLERTVAQFCFLPSPATLN